MVRNWKAKTNRGKNSNVIRQAARGVLEKKLSVRAAAKSHGVSFSTVNRLINRIKANTGKSDNSKHPIHTVL